jgi:putative ABC transport system substrate-binding protein
MRRRKFLGVLGGAAAAGWPRSAHAQLTTSPRRIGVLLVGLLPESKEAQHFRRGLRDVGYLDGRNLVIEWRAAKGDYALVPKLIEDLVRSRVELIVMDSTVGTQVAMRTAPTIPIVMALVVDPVGSGLVKSLVSPGGNVTGLSMMTTDLNSKRLQLLKEVTPQLSKVAILWNPDHPFHARVVEDLKAIAPSLALQLTPAGVRTPDQFEAAFASIGGAQALYVVEDPIFFAHRATLLKLAANARLPTVHELRRFPEQGALMSYGPDLHDLFRRSALYVDRILKGGKPAELPVEQPTKFEFVINLTTAKNLGLDISPALLSLADDLVE